MICSMIHVYFHNIIFISKGNNSYLTMPNRADLFFLNLDSFKSHEYQLKSK